MIIDAFSRIVRLGEGLATSGRLSDAAIERAIAALTICAEKLKRRHVTLVRSVATEACRQAAKGPDFVRRVHAETGRLIDPHTAVAVAAAGQVRDSARDPVVVLSTAHPAKFPDAVQRATGQIPRLPPRLSGLYQKPEKMTVLAPELGLVRAHIAARVATS